MGRIPETGNPRGRRGAGVRRWRTAGGGFYLGREGATRRIATHQGVLLWRVLRLMGEDDLAGDFCF
jgi:hypothetical protein